MDGRLTCSSAVRRRDWSARGIVPGVQKCFRTRLKSVVLSGFPTALEPTLPPLVPGANASTLPSNWRARQLPRPRDDIPPPPPVVVCARSLPPPPGPDMWFLLPFVFTQGCSMERPDRILSWWDQEVDRNGRQIRGDVRSAAHEVWKEACRRTQSLLADPAQAADVMEDSVARVSRYLDRIGAPSSSPKNGLLLLAFSRALRRLAAKSRRLEPAGGAVELSSRAVDQRLEPPSRRATGSGKHRSKTQRKKQRGLGSQSGRLQLGGSCPGTRNVSGDGSQQLLARSQRFETEVPS